MTNLTTWSGSLHLTYHLIPPSDHLIVILDTTEGESPASVARRMPFDVSRSRSGNTTADARRYRDAKQLYETAGFLYVKNDGVRFTALGRAVKRFLPKLNEANSIVLARHAALALNSCQLRNPTDAGSRYDESMKVFPNRFIWKSMLLLDNMINSDELNRAIFRVQSETDLAAAVARIREYRSTQDVDVLGAETITDKKKNDRIISFVSVASFGWVLITRKNESSVAGYYEIRTGCRELLRAAVNTPVRHKTFESIEAYMQHVAASACLPEEATW
jgi:hypothetical protein